jgi:quercetin dioxygenase-like cupin family protein
LAQREVENHVLVLNSNIVAAEDMGKIGAQRVKVQYLIDERHGSNRFALRQYTVEKGGHTPLDQHQYEHHVYVLAGRGLLRESKDGPALRELHAGDVIFVPSNGVHQFLNERDEPFVFLCVKGNPKLYSSKSGSQEPSDRPEESNENSC